MQITDTFFINPVINTNLSLSGKWPTCSPVAWSSVPCVLNASQRGLKERSNKLLTGSELSSVKSSAQMHECFEGVKHSIVISIRHSLLSFESWVNLKVLTLDFELFVQ